MQPTDEFIYRKRLLKLAKLLEDLPDKQYNHGYFMNNHHCGTTYCALGYAAASPIFKNLKLKFIDDKLVNTDMTFSHSYYDIGKVADKYFGPGAFNEIFDTYAFKLDDGNVTKDMVIKRIYEKADEYEDR